MEAWQRPPSLPPSIPPSLHPKVVPMESSCFLCEQWFNLGPFSASLALFFSDCITSSHSCDWNTVDLGLLNLGPSVPPWLSSSQTVLASIVLGLELILSCWTWVCLNASLALFISDSISDHWDWTTVDLGLLTGWPWSTVWLTLVGGSKNLWERTECTCSFCLL